MRHITISLVLAAFLMGTHAGVAQEQKISPYEVGLKTEKLWQFTLGGHVDDAYGFVPSRDEQTVFIYGYRILYFGNAEYDTIRAAVMRFSLNGGWPVWYASDCDAGRGTFGINATLCADEKRIFWTGVGEGNNALFITNTDSTGIAKYKAPEDTKRTTLESGRNGVYLVPTLYHDSIVVAIETGTGPKVLLFDGTGAVTRSFVYAPHYTNGVIHGFVRGDSLWVQAVYDANLRSFLALYDLSTGTQLWRTDFPGYHMRIRFAVGADGRVYVAGNRIIPNDRMYFSYFILNTDGSTAFERNMWLARNDTSVDANVANFLNFVALHPNGRLIAVGATVQRDLTNTGRNQPYLAILDANTGEILQEHRWLWRSTSDINNFEDGKFTRDGQLLLQGRTFNGGSATGYFSVMSMTVTGVEQISDNVPEGFHLRQNYPNPFNPKTTIEFELPERSTVRITVLNLLGQELETLVNEDLPAGVHRSAWNATHFPSGVYLYRIETAKFQSVRKMLLVK